MGENSKKNRADRLQSLGLDTYSSEENKPSAKSQANYSRIIKSLRVVLPLIALSLILIIFLWQRIENTQSDGQTAEPVQKTARTIGKNELVNPKFESTDDKGNPYIITAQRGLQGQSEEDDLIILEKPVADIALENNQWLAVKADQSAFRQETQRLLLKGNVEMFHDQGYTLQTSELDVDMKAGTANNDVDVHIQGPKGTIDAKGLNAQREAGKLIFKGPAKLTLSGTEL